MMAKKLKQVIGIYNSTLFNVHKGLQATVLRSFWRNGEGWYLLEACGKQFESPDVFWEEK